MNKRLPVWCFLALVGTFSGCSADKIIAAGHSDIGFSLSPQGDLLAFSATGDGGRDLYMFDLRRNHVSRMSRTPERERGPSFSPDGKLVAFVGESSDDSGNHIYVQSVNGDDRRQLTTGYLSDASPAFSPNGSLLVFSRSKSYNRGGLAARWNVGNQLCVMNADGSGLRQIDTGGLYVVDPRFSPDGKQIVFSEGSGLYLVAAGGQDKPRPVDGIKGRQAMFSPDGQLLLYVTGRYERDQRILVARADGTAARVVGGPEINPSLSGGCTRPAFTSDGQRFMFLCNLRPEGPSGPLKCSLWEATIGGGGPHELADYKLFDEPLTYSRRGLRGK